jgi:predicted acyl esterase
MKEGYIVVYQDVRGRYMSDGLYDNMRGFIPNRKIRKILMKPLIPTTRLIDWLVKKCSKQ